LNPDLSPLFMSASSSPMPLGMLLSQSLSYVRTYIQPILVGAVLFGTVMALIGGSIAYKAGSGVAGMMQGMGIDTNQMQQLSQRIKAGDQTAADEMQKILDQKFNGM